MSNSINDLFQTCVRIFYHIVTRINLFSTVVRLTDVLHADHVHCTSILIVAAIPSCGLVVPIVLSRVHQKRNSSCLMYRKFNSVWVRYLWLLLNWYLRKTIGSTSPHLDFCSNSILLACGTNSGMSRSPESELQGPNAYIIEFSMH